MVGTVRPGSLHPLEADEIGVILDSVADGVFTVDGEFRVTSFKAHSKSEICANRSVRFAKGWSL